MSSIVPAGGSPAETSKASIARAVGSGPRFRYFLRSPRATLSPIRANSAEEGAQYGIQAERAESVSDPEVAELAGDLYERAEAVSV